MKYDVTKCLIALKNKNQEILNMKKNLIQTKKTYEMLIKTKQTEIDEAEKEKEKLENMPLPITLRELINELANLLNINEEEFDYILDTNISYTKDIRNVGDMIQEIISDYENEHILTVEIFDKKKNTLRLDNKKTTFKDERFSYIFNVPLDIYQRQIDNKGLFEHCYVTSISSGTRHIKYHSFLEIDENFKDILLNFNLKFLNEQKNTIAFYPKDIFNKAVINCLDRKLNNENINIER